ncbi:MAG: AAA family ATPase [Candidatus Aenigmarchaeota archaeon]|nr:AAA family ATPase [Candidatus Aenigmarchaeota archaeon]MDW8149795.1 AAA family ATPase [Candidatus Aenigmarchaeota archaeon]
MIGRVINISSGKGGVGKTTIAINVGWILAEVFNKEVTIIDCNITTSHLGLYLGIFYSPVTLNRILRGEASIEEAIHFYSKNLKIIPASNSISDLIGVDIISLGDVLNKMREKNDIIILDSAPGLGREALGSLKFSDEVIFVTQPYLASVMDIVRAYEAIKDTNIKPLGIVLNMVFNDRFEMDKREIEQLTELPVIAKIPFDKNMRKSSYLSIPLASLNRSSKSIKEMLKLSAFLIGEKYKEERLFDKLIEKIKKIFK